jgi:uncharacterized cupredoxin-like copper-binding protein
MRTFNLISTILLLTFISVDAEDKKKSTGRGTLPEKKIELSAQGNPPGTMKYAQSEIKIKAGQPVRMTFKNPDLLQHNVIIIKPGTLAKVGALADAMLTDPEAMKKSFIPKSPDILHSTALVNPGGQAILKFTIAEPGNYPIICTFPGHWRLMNAVLKVVK